MHVILSDLGPWHVLVCLWLHSGARLHIVNLYLPPMHSPAIESEADMWGDVVGLLGSLPSSDPVVVVGDLNAHLGGHSGV